MNHYVHFSKEAITQILLNGFESYVIKHKHKKRSGIEMFASIYGSKRITSSERHYYVKFISVDTSAEMQSGCVIYNASTLNLKRALAKATEFSQLGTMHSHPYLPAEMSLAEVRKRGCRFSKDDIAFIKYGLRKDPNRVLQVLLTIRKQEKDTFKCDGFKAPNIFEFTMARCKCFLKAQVFSLDDTRALMYESTNLRCEYLERFDYIAESCKVVTEKGKQRILVHQEY